MNDMIPQAETELPAGESAVTETASPSIEETMDKAYDDSASKLEARDEQRRTIVRGANRSTENGKFVRKDLVAEKPAVSPETAAPTVRQAPIAWPQEMKAEFAKLSPAAQELVERRERESHQKITELGQVAKSSETFRQIGERYAETFRGRQPAQAFEQLAAASEFLDLNPVQGIQLLAQSYGVDLSQLAGGAPMPMHDPGALKSNEALVLDFAQGKSDWAALENDVLAQMHAIRATDPDLPPQTVLERAYERASQLNPMVSAQRREKDTANARAQAAQRAAAAKRAGSVNVKSGQGISPKASGNWESTMREAAERIMGR